MIDRKETMMEEYHDMKGVFAEPVDEYNPDMDYVFFDWLEYFRFSGFDEPVNLDDPSFDWLDDFLYFERMGWE